MERTIYKPGSVILVSNKDGTLPKIIQLAQKKEDQESGIYNHSGLIRGYKHPRITEMAVIRTPAGTKKIKAACISTPLHHYTDQLQHGMRLLVLVPNFIYDEDYMEEFLQEFYGTPYDYDLLLRRIPGDILLDVEKYEKKKSALKNFACHKFSQWAWHEFSTKKLGFDMFPEWYKGRVSALYHSPHFIHEPLILIK